MDYRYGSHTVYQIEYPFVWVTKYRYKALRGQIAERVRDLVRQTCEAFAIRIIKGVVSKDHGHILVSEPPKSQNVGWVSVTQQIQKVGLHRIQSNLPFTAIALAGGCLVRSY